MSDSCTEAQLELMKVRIMVYWLGSSELRAHWHAEQRLLATSPTHASIKPLHYYSGIREACYERSAVQKLSLS